jgi:hypothetical protein
LICFSFFDEKKTSYLQQEESNRGRGLPGVGMRRGSGHEGRLGVVSLKGVGVSLKRIKL